MFFLITRVCKCNKFLWNLSHQLTRKSRAHGDKLKLFMTWKKTFYWQFLMQRILTNKVNKKEHFPWRHSCSCSLETLPLDNNKKKLLKQRQSKIKFRQFWDHKNRIACWWSVGNVYKHFHHKEKREERDDWERRKTAGRFPWSVSDITN